MRWSKCGELLQEGIVLRFGASVEKCLRKVLFCDVELLYRTVAERVFFEVELVWRTVAGRYSFVIWS